MVISLRGSQGAAGLTGRLGQGAGLDVHRPATQGSRLRYKGSGSAGRGSEESEALRLGTLGEAGWFGPPRFLPLSMRGHNGHGDQPYGAQPMALRLRLVVCPPILSPLPH